MRAKITTALVLGLFFVSALIVFLISGLVNRQMANYEKTVAEMTGNHLKAAVQTLARLVDAEELDLFHSAEDTFRPEYREIKERLIKFSEEYNILFAYYWRDYGNGKFQFIIDNDLDPKTQVGPEYIGEILDEAELSALAGNVNVTDLGSYSPGWEKLLSAHAPVYDKNGNIYCVAGVDISDEYIFIQRRDARNMTLLQLVAIPASVFFAALNMLLYRKKAKQIEEAHIKLQYFNNNLRRAFSTYLSENVVEEIVSDPARLELGGIKRHMTALFTDIKDFSAIAESLSPEHLVEMLNYYLSSMSDIILQEEGTIDKYEGDAIVSFFGAPLDLPDHALRACTTAVRIKRLENEVNNYIEEKKLSPLPLYTRIGINSGEMIVGNMGTKKKMNYTIVSNAVNLAARLEGVNKQYGTWILASENTIRETGSKLLARRLDRVRVVGINEPVRIYEVVDIFSDAPKALHEKIILFHQALDLFEKRDWESAEIVFNHVQMRFPDDSPSKIYLERCRQYQAKEPDRNWDGVFDLTEK
jgi:class 3 adenylate cyclase